MNRKESNDEENGFTVEDQTSSSSSTTKSGSETDTYSPLLPPKNTVTTPNNALAITEKQNALNSNLFNNLPLLLPLSPISQQENCALGLNSNSPSSKMSNNGMTNGTESSKISENATTGGNTKPKSTEILVNQ